MPNLSIMIKPSSSLCNMRCKYCFYHDVAENREHESFGIMADSTAEKLISDALNYADGGKISFTFQGGEPLLAGMEFFENFICKVKQLNTKNSNINYSMQTNGLLINDKWAEFLYKNNFLVGLSLDGDRKGNKFRVDAENIPTFERIIKSAETLKKHNVEFNILTVLTGYCADNIERIYRFFTNRGFKYLQFIPCLKPFGYEGESELFMTLEQCKNFLIKSFKMYTQDYINGSYTSVRQFDNWIQMTWGNPPEQCGFCGRCSHQFVIEGNGNVYPCDFYCLDEYLLGNVNENNFEDMANGAKAQKFIKESFNIDERCKNCRFYPLCRGGGCKRTKASSDYCEAYKTFFTECLPMFNVFRQM